jgi:hypothetical protein
MARSSRIRDLDVPPGRIANLVMIWRYAIRYPGTIAGAAAARLWRRWRSPTVSAD